MIDKNQGREIVVCETNLIMFVWKEMMLHQLDLKRREA